MPRDEGGRTRQRLRTRKDLLESALKLSTAGRKPTLEEVAEAAMVSRATAYRYFPSIDTLLAEASLHVAFPDVATLMEGAGDEPVERLNRLDEATAAMIARNEPALRLMVSTTTRQALVEGDVPARQNRRSPAIAATLEPCRDRFDLEAYDKLQKALALVIGTEAMLVFKDVLRLSDAEAAAVRRWAIAALVEKALKA